MPFMKAISRQSSLAFGEQERMDAPASNIRLLYQGNSIPKHCRVIDADFATCSVIHVVRTRTVDPSGEAGGPVASPSVSHLAALD
jgi:hypothetical protein